MSQQPTPEPRSDYGLKKYANVIATVAAAVAILGGIIAFLAWYTGREQLQTGREQLRTTQLQARPYVRARPIFTTKGQALAFSVHTERKPKSNSCAHNLLPRQNMDRW